jgi:apolipoprotein N-acyltransferase
MKIFIKKKPGLIECSLFALISSGLLRLAFPPFNIWILTFFYALPLFYCFENLDKKSLVFFCFFSGLVNALMGLWFMKAVWPGYFLIILTIPASIQGLKLLVSAFAFKKFSFSGLVLTWVIINWALLWCFDLMPFVIESYPLAEISWGRQLIYYTGLPGAMLIILSANVFLYRLMTGKSAENIKGPGLNFLILFFSLFFILLFLNFFQYPAALSRSAASSKSCEIIFSQIHTVSDRKYQEKSGPESGPGSDDESDEVFKEPSGPQSDMEHYLQFALLQGNIDQHKKGDPHYRHQIGLIYFHLMSRAVKTWKNEIRHLKHKFLIKGAQLERLIIWPETSSPGILRYDTLLLNKLSAFAHKNRTNILVGTRDVLHSENNEDFFSNSAVLIDSHGIWSQTQDKHILTSFTETNPYTGSLSFMNRFRVIDHLTVSGEKPGFFRLENFSFGSLICYEALFPGCSAYQAEKGADFLVNLSNDAWFHGTSEPECIAQEAAVRSYETGLPMLRACNSGITYAADKKRGIFLKTKMEKRAYLSGILRCRHWPGN